MIKKALTTHDIAKHCNVTPRTVIQWISEGKMNAYRTPGNHSRVEKEEFLKFLKEYKMPIPFELEQRSDKKTILIVDDDKAMVNSINRIFSFDERFDIQVAYDGFEAGKMFILHKPDLVILDIRMPKVDGLQLCRAIRNDPDNKDVKIFIVSGVVNIEGPEKILKSGADDCLPKPFDADELKRKVCKAFSWNRRQEDLK